MYYGCYGNTLNGLLETFITSIFLPTIDGWFILLPVVIRHCDSKVTYFHQRNCIWHRLCSRRSLTVSEVLHECVCCCVVRLRRTAKVTIPIVFIFSHTGRPIYWPICVVLSIHKRRTYLSILRAAFFLLVNNFATLTVA